MTIQRRWRSAGEVRSALKGRRVQPAAVQVSAGAKGGGRAACGVRATYMATAG